jgi:excisionase family DNA binding protein
MTPRLLTLDEVAATLRVSPRTARRLVAESGIVGLRLGPRTLRVREDDLLRFIAALAAPATGETQVSRDGGRRFRAGERLWDEPFRPATLGPMIASTENGLATRKRPSPGTGTGGSDA